MYHRKVLDNPLHIPYSYFKMPRLVYHVMANTDYIEKYFILNGSCYLIDFSVTLYSENCLEMLFIMYILLLVHYVKPFYEMSYVAYHIAFMYKTYLICKMLTHPMGDSNPRPLDDFNLKVKRSTD